MSAINPEVQRRAIEFTSRFGFITRDIFFDYLCHFKHTQKYRSWRRLLDNHWLIPHDSDRLSAYLSKKARLNFALNAVPSRSQYFIEHDAIAARMVLELDRLKVVNRYWTERELASKPWEVYSILGSSHADKIPDLVVDLIGSYGYLRVALEVERTGKSKQRYDAAALSYLMMKNVDLVIYGCRSWHLADLVRSSFQGELFKKSNKLPAIFLTETFTEKRMSTPIAYREQKFEMLNFVSRALKLNLNPIAQEPAYNERTAVRSGEDAKKAAA